MTYFEWVDRYGKESANKMFGVTDHVCYVVYDGYVTATCGRWHGSEPLKGSPRQVWHEAINNLQNSINPNGTKTSEVLWVGDLEC